MTPKGIASTTMIQVWHVLLFASIYHEPTTLIVSEQLSCYVAFIADGYDDFGPTPNFKLDVSWKVIGHVSARTVPGIN